jgi:CubicO group peptidase (beta-lactamase class C family)
MILPHMHIPSFPRLPVIGDPLRRIRVPDDLDAVTTIGPESPPADLEPDSVARIWRAAVDLYRSGVHPAVQVCVRHHGSVVLNRAIGHARGNGPQDEEQTEKVLATPETPFVTYSCSKAVTATVVHLLHERGALDIEQPVSAYVPEYRGHGKETITIAHVLAHRAGVPSLSREVFDLDRATDREFILDSLAKARPIAKPGRFLAYHAVSGGFILAEVVYRVTGKDIRTVLAEEILDPLGFKFTNYGVDEDELDSLALNYVTGPPTAPPMSQLIARALGLPFDALVDATNDPRFLRAIVPSANLVSTAVEFSRFFELLRRGGELDGVRVIRAETMRDALREQSHLEVDLSLVWPTRFSYGFMLGARLLSLYGRDTQHAFGHLGFTNMLAWADPERALSCAVMTNGKPTVYPELPRLYNLISRMTSSAPKVSGRSMRVWDPLAGRPD